MKKIITILTILFLNFALSFAVDYYPLNPAIKITYKVHHWDGDHNYTLQIIDRQIKNTIQQKTEVSPNTIEIREYLDYKDLLVGPDFLKKGTNEIYFWSDAAADDINGEYIGKEGIYLKLNANIGEIWNVIGFSVNETQTANVIARITNKNANITINEKNYNNCLYIEFAGLISGSTAKINWIEYLAPDIGLIKRETFLDNVKVSLIEIEGEPASLTTTNWGQIKKMFK